MSPVLVADMDRTVMEEEEIVSDFAGQRIGPFRATRDKAFSHARSTPTARTPGASSSWVNGFEQMVQQTSRLSGVVALLAAASGIGYFFFF